ncbi:ABC-type branched-subunit amino acid transport system ATPase component [Mycetocola sp. BIGb0189]|uniref:ATP-binding cassette domain-containing protein n=1 Tax=Mycetocola sp. BIGb0189 TaxID=2940604 RepID=UPI002167283A|nr:ATP-binding cassette domain-containing protein [Mycetocola sp. BIGb0189]MCS4276629.1 ABC-type branched-subunit amino acid transport system ATPase component [Mycetocola sp. BIGb0189]
MSTHPAHGGQHENEPPAETVETAIIEAQERQSQDMHEAAETHGRHGASPDNLLTLTEVSVRASWGHIFGPVNFSVKRGGTTVLVGHGGRGRTALLLTLAGRMRASSGTVVSFGLNNNPGHLFKNAALGWIDEVDEVVQAIRVRDIVTEQLRWGAPWYRWVRVAREEDLERMCRPVFGDLALPGLDDMVEELPELTAALFRIAAANVRKPELLVVGGVDNLSSDQASEKLLERLIALGTEQTVITADVNGRRGSVIADDYVEVPNLTNQQFVSLALEEVEEAR